MNKVIEYLVVHPGVDAVGAAILFVWATAYAFWVAEREGSVT